MSVRRHLHRDVGHFHGSRSRICGLRNGSGRVELMPQQLSCPGAAAKCPGSLLLAAGRLAQSTALATFGPRHEL